VTGRAAALVEVLGGDVAVVAVALRRLARQARANGLVLDRRLVRLLTDAEAAEQLTRPGAVPRLQLPGSAPPPWALTVEQVAQRVGVTTRAVRKAAATGRLPGRQDGGRWWFHESDVQAWQAGRRSA
jgi:excisionase family DNA binding protein